MITQAGQQYLKDGKLPLTVGCIHAVFNECKENSENMKILQITNFKTENKNKLCAKAKVIDGAFAYQPVFFDESLTEQLERDGITNDSVGKDNAPIIATRSISPSGILLQSNRLALLVKSYELLYTGCGPLVPADSLIKYSGEPRDHQGFENAKTTPVFVTVNAKMEVEEDVKPAVNSRPSVPTTSFPSRAAAAAPPVNKSVPMATRGPPPPTKSNSNGTSNLPFTEIKSITPYASNKWRIKGVVTAKEEMRTVKMKSGESKVFNFDVCDKTATIRCAAFGDVAEKTYPMIYENQMVIIGGCNVRSANKRFNTTGHEYELSMNANSEIVPCSNETPIVIPFELKNRVRLDELPRKVGEAIDVLACIDRVNPYTTFTSKNGQEYTKREISLIDQSGLNINFVLWSEQAKSFPEHTEGQPLGIRGAFVKEFNGGLSLGAQSGTKFVLTPDVDGMTEMCEWFKNDRGQMQTQSLSVGVASEGALARDLRLLGTANALQLGRGEPMYMNIKGRIMTIKGDTAIYKACPSEGCSKKVVEQDDQYRCDKCNISGDQFKMAYMLQMEICDYTGRVWITMFGKNAEQFMGMTAEALGEIKNDNSNEYEAVFERLKYTTRVFRVRAKAEVYNDEERVKYTGFNVDIPDYNKLNPILDGVIGRLNTLPTY